MSMAPMNPFMGEVIQTAVPGVTALWIQKADFQLLPIATSNVYVLSNTALTVATQAITTGIASPDVPRNIVIKGALAGSTGNVTITGTDYMGTALTEIIALSGTAVVVGNKAFMAVTQVALPIQSGAGDGVSVGIGSKLGLPYTLAKNVISKAYNNNVLETTSPTVVFDAVNICNNTVTLASALAGNLIDISLDIPG